MGDSVSIVRTNGGDLKISNNILEEFQLRPNQYVDAQTFLDVVERQLRHYELMLAEAIDGTYDDICKISSSDTDSEATQQLLSMLESVTTTDATNHSIEFLQRYTRDMN